MRRGEGEEEDAEEEPPLEKKELLDPLVKWELTFKYRTDDVVNLDQKYISEMVRGQVWGLVLLFCFVLFYSFYFYCDCFCFICDVVDL